LLSGVTGSGPQATPFNDAPAGIDYADFSVTLYPFACSLVTKEITLHEHKEVKWLPPEELLSLDWAEADIPFIKGYLEGRDREVNK
jgi:hypothetical protein